MQIWLIKLYLNWSIFNALRDEDNKEETDEASRYETLPVIELIFVYAMILNISCQYFIQIWLIKLFLIWSIFNVSRDEDSEQEKEEEEDTIGYNWSDLIHWLYIAFIF